jgi:GWxTD domain-containing protein
MRRILLILVLVVISLSISAEPISLPQKEGHVFSVLKEEYKLVSYFLSPNQRKYYKKLNKENRWEYISAFWKAQDPNPATENNEFLSEIIARIEYCNKHFSHFNKGWKTDIGRIYIKHGKPFEILKLNTGTSTKFAQKEYQIWKYRISSFQTYLFIDLHQHRDYRLIYSDGDEAEGSWADWLNYLGSNFDEGLLQ